jgi:hypothetical protein
VDGDKTIAANGCFVERRQACDDWAETIGDSKRPRVLR